MHLNQCVMHLPFFCAEFYENLETISESLYKNISEPFLNHINMVCVIPFLKHGPFFSVWYAGRSMYSDWYLINPERHLKSWGATDHFFSVWHQLRFNVFIVQICGTPLMNRYIISNYFKLFQIHKFQHQEGWTIFLNVLLNLNFYGFSTSFPVGFMSLTTVALLHCSRQVLASIAHGTAWLQQMADRFDNKMAFQRINSPGRLAFQSVNISY